MRIKYFFIVIFLFLASASFAQSKKRKNDDRDQSTSLDPYYPKETATPKKNKTAASAKITYDNAEEEFYDRMEALEKTRRKNEKLMEQPQYSDPLYFGHKRPPKKHKPSKMKFCKVCGIRH